MGDAPLSIADFLAWEQTQSERHEFVRGKVFARVGARRVHGRVSLKVSAALKSQLRGSPWLAFNETMKPEDMLQPWLLGS